MKSPPASPPHFELGGASRVTGGILRGRAYGKTFIIMLMLRWFLVQSLT